MSDNGLDRHPARHFTRITASHSVTDDVQPEGGLRREAIFVMRPSATDVGFGNMRGEHSHGTSLLCREARQTGPKVLRQLSGPAIPLGEFLLQRSVNDLLQHRGKIPTETLQVRMRMMCNR